MTEETQSRQRKTTRIWLAIAAVVLLLAVAIVPPFLSINRYKKQITSLLSSSVGRPVRLSSMELRVLPRPSFVLTDLSVEEDPSYGAEPVLHANTVTASIRLLPLWRGRLEISRISVDEASLNLVRTADGRWNLDPIFQTAAARSNSTERNQSKTLPMPYLEATNSRINIKQGFEKLPYSLVNADLSFSEDDPGNWHIRLRGQPARTDLSLDLGDTGIVQLETRLRSAQQMRQMPIRLDLEWREAQLGQLSRLILGTDPGWRGDLTGEMHLEGTADSAQVTTRLRASGVHRAEFAPAAPLDFDANCGFIYHYSSRYVEKLVCESPLGDGHMRIEGDLPQDHQPKLSVEFQRIPAQAGLDALRTIRSNFGPGIEARGTITGKLTFDPSIPIPTVIEAVSIHRRTAKDKTAKDNSPVPGPLSGSMAIESLQVRGGALSQPVLIPKITLQPAPAALGPINALVGTFAVPAGAPGPLAGTLRLSVSGYQFSMHGSATLTLIRELARAAGLTDGSALDGIACDPVTLDLGAEGPWLPAPDLTQGSVTMRTVESAASRFTASFSPADQLVGTITLHNANWKSDAFATAVQIPQAILHLGEKTIRWDPVAFAYGPLKGTGSVDIPSACGVPDQCPPRLNLQFDELDAGVFETTLLGAQKPGSLLSSVMAKLSSSPAKAWPPFAAEVRADSLLLGPVTFQNADVELQVSATGAELSSIDAELLGGKLHATGKMINGDKPAYSFEGDFQKISPAAMCELVGLSCKGSALEGNGNVNLSGFTDKDLGGSAKGNLHFEWIQGTVLGNSEPSIALPAALARFDHWTADAEISNGVISLKQNQVRQGARKASVGATVTFGNPPKVSFAVPKPSTVAQRPVQAFRR
jgi:hypothetical protein